MSSERILRAQLQAASIGLDVEIIKHQESGRTTAQAAEALGVGADKIIKSLVLYCRKEERFVGFIILGTDKLDMKKACQVTGTKRLRFASSEQVKTLTGFDIGGVPPAALQMCSDMFVDDMVVQRNFAIGAGGDEHCGMRFSPRQLVEKANAKVAAVSARAV